MRTTVIAALFVLVLGTAGSAQQAPRRITIPFTAPSARTTGQATEPAGTVVLGFSETPVADVLSVYERILGRPVVRVQIPAGTNLTLDVGEPVEKSRALRMIESAVFGVGLAMVDAPDGSVLVCGGEIDPRTLQIPTHRRLQDLPEAERVCLLALPIRARKPSELVPVLKSSVGGTAYSKLVPDDQAGVLLLTDTTSRLRAAAAVVESLDRSPVRTEPAPPRAVERPVAAPPQPN